ncbi:MAG TPA: MFS transporter [Xanthobacteraceae bacterium]|jgi:CP family cyanate transporter-like MFS transporter
MPPPAFPDPSPAGLFRLLCLLWAVGVSARITILAVPPINPLLHDDLHLSETGIGLLNGLPLGLFALAAIPGSLLVARIGVRRTMLVGLAVTVVASAGRSASLDAFMLYATTALMGFGVAIMQPAIPALVRAWVPTHIGLGTAVSTNGMVIGATLGSSLTVPFVLPWVEGSWRHDLVLWSALAGVIAIVFAAFSPRAATAGSEILPAAQRWWPDWKNPVIWLLGMAFGSTNSLYYGANAFLPGYLVAQGRPDLVGAALAFLNGSQLLASVTLLVVADRLHRRVWPHLVFGPLAFVGLLAVMLTAGGWTVVAAGVVGFASAIPFVLLLALPPVLSAPGDVHRMAAGMFTISYACAVIIPVISGAIWDLTGAAWTAFVPLGVCALAVTGLGAALNRLRAPA